jgi:dethiobiotin synthetase
VFRGIFVTGTDTGVGKTVAAAALVHRYRQPTPDFKSVSCRATGSVRYWKPIQTGIEQDDDTATIRRLGCRDDEVLEAGVRLPRPVSPHLAARLSGQTIVVQDLIDIIEGQPLTGGWIVEGAGGVLVPVNTTALMVDLMAQLDLPVLVVARTTLGTINHTLLTLEAARSAGLEVGMVVLTPWPQDPGPIERSNLETIATLGAVKVEKLPALDLRDPRRWPALPPPPPG